MNIQAEALAAGILADYYDARGQHRHVPLEVLERVVGALPKPRPDMSAAPIIHRAGAGPIRIPAPDFDAQARWQLLDGARRVGEGHVSNGVIHAQDLETGIYRLELEDRPPLPLLVVPPMAFQGDFDRVWVLAVQLYSLRSERNWGIGDFTDLKDLVEMSAALGCAGIGLNPLHALFDDEPASCSPYAPNSRLFINPLYIDIDAVAEFDGLDGETREAIACEKDRELIDYTAVSRWKLKALRQAYVNFRSRRSRARSEAFDAFRHQRGDALKQFAVFEAMRRRFRRPWWEWPQEHRRPDGGHVLREETDDEHRGFVEYLQWIAHDQLQRCTDLAKQSHLKVGLYLDVAVGVRADGFDAWFEQEAISRELSVGAPPDLLNVEGQDWGLAGFNGIGLAARFFEPFRAMIEASARYAGAIRLDHVMGLARLFLVPSGFTPRDGAYVTMPLDALLAVTALESQARRCIIIGEDLGTVPEGFREKLREWGVWSYQVMLFEREHDGRFKSPDRFSVQALVTFNTHDLPSYAGWRDLHDMRVKLGISVDPGESDEERRRSIAALDSAIGEHQAAGIAVRRTASLRSPMPFSAVIDYLSRTPSRILSVSYDDIVGVVEQINVPGTVDTHPNWRRRVPVPIEDFRARYQASGLPSALAQRDFRK